MDEQEKIAKLKQLAAEADMLLSKHDGVHNMHGSRAAMHQWLHIAETLGVEKVTWPFVDMSIRKMRQCDRTGQYPRNRDIELRQDVSWQDI